MTISKADLLTPLGLTPQEQRDYWRAMANEMYGLLKELIDIEGPQPGHVMWARRVQVAIDKAEGR